MTKIQLKQIIREVISEGKLLKEYDEHTFTDGSIEMMVDMDSKIASSYIYKDAVDEFKEILNYSKYKNKYAIVNGKNPLFKHIKFNPKIKTDVYVSFLEANGLVDISNDE